MEMDPIDDYSDRAMLSLLTLMLIFFHGIIVVCARFLHSIIFYA